MNPRVLSALALVGLLSCGDSIVPTQPIEEPAQVFWAITLDQHAVTLAMTPPFDTLAVVATPRNPSGTPLDGLGPVTFTSTDLTKVRVGPDGVLQAVAPGTRVLVIAKLQAQGVTNLDTVVVDVTPTAPASPIASLSIQPIPPDSAKLGNNAGAKFIEPRVTDADGNPYSGLLVDFISLEPTIGRIDRAAGSLGAQGQLGQARIVASATAYGVRVADTVTYRFGLPVAALIEVHPGSMEGVSTVSTFVPAGVRIGVGATVLWLFLPDVPTDVIFDEPAFAEEDPMGVNGLGALTGAGDLPSSTGCTFEHPENIFTECFRARRFTVPGVYRFHSTVTGVQGQIIVEAE
jgi:plastocyanin